MEAFAKLFGYVRYFHPSDEAAELDWVQFAVYGADKVKDAKNTSELKAVLEEIFLPIAPTMNLYLDNENPESVKITRNSSEVIAWQHFGMGNSEDPDHFYKSKRISASVENGETVLGSDKLFDEYPKLNEAIEKEISAGINCYIPLVLDKDANGTIGHSDLSRKNFERIVKEADNAGLIHSSADENVRFAGIIVTWNVFQHFYPNFHVTDSDWNNQLRTALETTAKDKNRDDYINSLLQLLEKTKDGHAKYILDSEKYPWNDKLLPFIADSIDDKLVVTVTEENSGLKPGDIILSKNGISSHVLLEQLKSEIPGSVQWKSYVASNIF